MVHNLGKQSKAHVGTVGGIVTYNERNLIFTAGHPFEAAASSECSDITPLEDEDWGLNSNTGSEGTDVDECMERMSPDGNPSTSQADLVQDIYQDAASRAVTTDLKLSGGPHALELGEVSADGHPISALSTTLDYALIDVSTSEALVLGGAADAESPWTNRSKYILYRLVCKTAK